MSFTSQDTLDFNAAKHLTETLNPERETGLTDALKGRYTFRNQAGENGEEDFTEIELVGIIGDWFAGNSAEDFARKMRAVNTNKLVVKISSPGGLFYDGLFMYRALKDFEGETVAYLSGLVASAATIFASGADTVVMTPEAEYMYHGIIIGGFGNVQEWEAVLESARKSNDNIAAIYGRKSKNKKKDFFARKINTGKDNWLTAKEAKEIGLVDKIDDRFSFAASALPGENYFKEVLKFNSIPERVRAKYFNHSEMNEQEQKDLNVLQQIKAFASGELVHIDKLNEATAKGEALKKEMETLKAEKTALEGQVENAPEADTITKLNNKIVDLEKAAKNYGEEATKLNARIAELTKENEALKKANTEFAADTSGEVIDIQGDKETAEVIGKRKLDKYEQEEAEAKAIDEKLKARAEARK